jgi:hypothetical protein
MTRLALFGSLAMLVSVAVAVAVAVNSAQASDLSVAWTAPAPACPDRAELREGLARRLGREVTFGDDATLRLSGQISAEDSGYVLELRTASNAGVEQRTLRARTCNELARASVLIASLLFAHQAPAAAASTALPPQLGTRRFYARAQLLGDLGTLPSPAFGPSVLFGMELAWATIELGGVWLPARDGSVSGRSEPAASLQLMAAVASSCARVLRAPSWSVSPCLHLELGALRAEGLHLTHTLTATNLWLMLGLSVRAGVELFRGLYWFSEVSAGLPWDRARFVIADLGEVHRVSGVVGRLATGLESHF